MSNPDLSQISAQVKNLGLLIGLLTGTNSDPDINPAWFTDPKEGLEEGFNWPNLQPVMESFLGEPDKNPAENADGELFAENWYPIEVEKEDEDGNDDGETEKSGFYIVQKTRDELALLGLGMHKTFELDGGKTTIDPFVFAPVFQMPAEGETELPLFAADMNGPFEIGFKLKYGSMGAQHFPYTQIIFAASFRFDTEDKKPKLTFEATKADGTILKLSEANIDIKGIINSALGLDKVVDFLEKQIIPGSDAVKFTWAQLFNWLGWLTTAAKPFEIGEIKIPDLPGTNTLISYVTDLLKTAYEKFMGTNSVIKLLASKLPKAEGDPDKKDKKPQPAWEISLIIHQPKADVKEYNYGINLQATNIVVKSSPKIVLQLGSLTGDKLDWMKSAGGGEMPKTKGVNFFVLHRDEQKNIKFSPQFEVISVGLDISKADKQPLFDVKGYTLKEAKLRGYFSSLQNNKWGVAVALNNIALPLGPTSNGSGVPQTLLASGDKKADEGKKADKKPAVNPEFSVLAAYQKNFSMQLFDKNGKAQDIVSIPLQRSFGPVALKDVGIGWQDKERLLLFQLNGGLNLNALKLDLDKLTVGVPVNTPGDKSKYKLSLDGFGLGFKSGSVSMAGGFVKTESEDPENPGTQYNGAVAIQAAKWGITAMGSFASIKDQPSLFIFGVLDAILGGPPVFFVTALAVGFGYNRKIVMPAINQVQNFPFVKAAVNPKLFSDKSNDILKQISEFVPPDLGQYWFAAGVKFTSFELLNSFALLAVQFGKKFEVDVLGLTTLQLPKQYADVKLSPYVNAQMAIKATFEPEEGILAVQAQLSDNSYVIHPDCKITGGFAYYSWFNGPHSGDFVVTLGGYNKNFDKEAYPHYPDVPRLAFNWNVSSSIKFSGDAYFALTPSCVMAGGRLDLTYQEGDLQAWFKAVADFLISWKPFHYDIAIGITVGVSYRVNIAFIHKTITVELGVNVQMWGPKFGGQAEVRLWIISFTVDFGTGKTKVEGDHISWTDFYNYFLTGDEAKPEVPGMGDANIGKTRDIISINTSAGLKEKYRAKGIEYWIVDPGTFAFNTESLFPVTQIIFVNGPAAIECNEFGVKPLGSITLGKSDSEFKVTISKYEEKKEEFRALNIKDWVFEAEPQNVPSAMYGTVAPGKENPDAKMVRNITKGITFAAPPAPKVTGPVEFGADVIKYSHIDKKQYQLDAKAELLLIELESKGSLDKIKTTINSTAIARRDEIFTALTDLGSLAVTNNSLKATALEPENNYQGSPMLANATAKPQALVAGAKVAETKRTHLRRNAVLTPGHQLKTTIIKYRFSNSKPGGVVLRGGVYNTSITKRMHLKSHVIGDDINTFTLNPGMLQVWELDSATHGDLLKHNGSMPVRLILLDENLRVLFDAVLEQSGENAVTIPANATQMCLQAMDPFKTGTWLSGWHEQTDLPLINPKYLVGRGCLIRPKNSQRVGYNQYSLDTGLVNGRNLVQNNTKAASGGLDGWIETRFFAGIKQVFVLAKPDKLVENAAFNLEVRLIYTDTNGRKQGVDLTPHKTGANGNELWASFAVPEVVPAGSHFSIWAATEAGPTSLAGVAGTNALLHDWTEALSSQLRNNDTSMDALSAKHGTSLSLKNALNF